MNSVASSRKISALSNFSFLPMHHAVNALFVGSGITFNKTGGPVDTTVLGRVHTAAFSYENGVKPLRFCLALTLLRCENGPFRKR